MSPPLAGGARADDRVLLAIGLLLASVLCFSILNASAKYLTQWFAASQIVWARYVFSFAFMMVVFMPRHGTRVFRVERLWSQVLRGFLLFMSSFLYFRGLAHLPLPTAASISQSSPLIVTAFSAPFLAEAVGLRRWVAVVIGFLGALIVVRPGMAGFDWHALFIVGSTTCSAFYQLVTRKYGGSERPEASATIATIVGTIGATPFLPFDWVTPNLWQLAAFVALGALAGLGHYFLTIAFSRAPAAIVAPFNYTQLIWAAALGYLIFGDLPDLWTWIGAGIIIGSGLYIARQEQVQRRRQGVG